MHMLVSTLSQRTGISGQARAAAAAQSGRRHRPPIETVGAVGLLGAVPSFVLCLPHRLVRVVRNADRAG